MAVGEFLLLLIAGIGAGILGSTAGLASLVSYPALLLTGIPPVTANVTNTVALIGSSVGSIAGSRQELRGQGRAIRRWLAFAVLGGASGAALLLLLPPGLFEAVVPFLVAFASVLLLSAPRLRAWAAHRRQRAGSPGTGRAAMVRLTAGLTAAWLYSGYFGAASGVMVLALLLAGTDDTLPRANALKNLLLGASNAIASVSFALFADVRWWAVLPLCAGCVVGGWIGPAIVRRVPPTPLRWAIGVAGFALAVRLWLG